MKNEEMLQKAGEVIEVLGSIYKVRKMSGFAFVLIRTRDQILQCVYGEFSHFSLDELKDEMCVRVTALVMAEERSRMGWELHLLELEILSEPAAEAPIVINQKEVDTSLENLLDYRPLTLRNEKQRAIFRIQEGIVRGFRQFLEDQGFTEIHTPKIVYAGAEGGANIFPITYFEKEAYLAQSPQFYKQMMVGVFERVYEIGPVFRAEHHDTSRHLNEYTGVDFEIGYITSFQEIMEMETGMIQGAFDYLKNHRQEELILLKVTIPEVTRIPQIPFHEAKKKVSQTFNRPITDDSDFDPEEEKLLCQLVKKEQNSDFVFVTHYPTKKRPFYAMETPENQTVTESFDLLFRGLEVTTGGQRIHSYEEQVKKMKDRGMDIPAFDSYLQAHKFGLPPHGGLGLGLERFTARLLELENIRQACLFPRDIHRLIP